MSCMSTFPKTEVSVSLDSPGAEFNWKGSRTGSGTLQTQAVPSGKKALVSDVRVSSMSPGRWILKVGATEIAWGRFGPGAYDSSLNSRASIPIPGPATVTLDVELTGGASADVDSNVLGVIV